MTAEERAAVLEDIRKLTGGIGDLPANRQLTPDEKEERRRELERQKRELGV
jgi:hypothetical protein